MNYIVLDMEWNQPWPGSPSSQKVLPVQIRGEIIQIGAVRVTEDQQVADEFQVLIKPKYYRRLNRRVSKLTGIKEAELRDNGLPMAQAMEKFRAWCGEDVIFLTWGFDDITILRENLLLYGIGRAGKARTLLPEAEAERILHMGAAGEAVGCYFDLSGRLLYQSSGVGLTGEQLRSVRLIAAVAAGSSKAEAILSVVRHHRHELLVIDEGAARALDDKL